jgi:hypothetical protein
MKSQVRTICVAVLSAVAFLPTVHAQTSLVYSRIEVPFSFNCGKTHLGAGTYTIVMNEQQNILTIRNATESAVVLAQVSYDPGRVSSSQALFKKCGNRYFLEEVKLAGSATDVSVLSSGPERRAARELARQGQQPTELALALLPERTLGN